ncbi:MAG: transcriptional regulator, partial [Algicola sp.]|nr:transcriptional regulator [Algicola sp.]
SFPEVELYWLMNGTGEFPAETKHTAQNATQVSEKISNTNPEQALSSSDKSIERIVIFYKDGSFKNFENS